MSIGKDILFLRQLVDIPPVEDANTHKNILYQLVDRPPVGRTHTHKKINQLGGKPPVESTHTQVFGQLVDIPPVESTQTLRHTHTPEGIYVDTRSKLWP